MEKDKIRPDYSELQGYLSQTPPVSLNDSIWEESVWTQYNETIKTLSNVAGEDLSRFCVKAKIYDHREPFVKVIEYRHKLGGLIAYLHGKYFSDEPAPFSGMPTTVISQSQQQNQSVQILLEVQSKIDEKIKQFKEGSNEKTFLQRLKGTLSSISNISQLFNTIFTLANQNGISLEPLHQFSSNYLAFSSKGKK